VYLPNDYSYIHFRSTLEKEEIIRGLNLFAGAQRQYDEKAMKEVWESSESESDAVRRDSLKKVYKGKSYESKFRNVPMQEEQIASQFDAEIGFSGRLEGLAQQVAPAAAPRGATGILPIQIQVPTGGQVYRFAKTIIKPEDPLVVSVTYTQSWLTKLLKWLIIVLILWIIYLKRRAVTRGLRWCAEKGRAINSWYKKHEKTIQKSARSPVTPFVLFGLFIVFSFVSKLLTLLTLFLFLISVGYHIYRYRNKRTKARSARSKRVKRKRSRR
jgi:cbb3-type cytochrome oxidase subunit 3